jgi:photosystem II cytochrome c550
MLRQWFLVRCLFAILATCLGMMLVSLPANALSIDPYLVRYLHVTEPVAIAADGQAQTRLFSPQELSQGKQLFKSNCMNCHVGGATLPNPRVSLSLKALKGANPPRDNIASLVTFMRQPMTYDNSQLTDWCREVPETWMSQQQVENLAAFILIAAQKAPGWGAEEF